MIIMALDHTRDFIHRGAMTFSPEDLTQTTPLLFFTRWITHVCAPTFVFLAGLGAFFRLQRTQSTGDLSRFLWTRGVWLILVELTVMRLAMNFTLEVRYPVLLLILWALGLSMMALAALIHVPRRVLLASSVGVIALHNVLDGVAARQFGAFAPLWNVLHQSGAFSLAGATIVVGYPVLPWIALIALGFCLGDLFLLDPARRRRVLAGAGLVSVALFVILRLVNAYGDPSPWSPQSTPAFTMLSFFRTTKYPPSLQFLLMTLGPALLALAALDGRPLSAKNPLVAIGRVPFFYYVVHFWLLHFVAVVLAWLRYGSASLAFLFNPLPSMGGARTLFPPDFGYSLGVTYGVWIGVVAALYLLCLWFSRVKARRNEWWISYV